MHEIRHSVCAHDCPSQCAVVVTVDDGRVTEVAGDAAHPFTQGVICGKVHDYAERLYAPTRVLTPLRRVGAKGEGRFEPIGWDAAIDLMSLVKQARQRGAFIVCIDPYRTQTAKKADLHLQPRPGTDGALALGMMHVLIGEGLVDHDYIQRATLGYGELVQHVKQYD